MSVNPITLPYYHDTRIQDVRERLQFVSKLQSLELKLLAEVLEIDRRGGMWPITKPGANSLNDAWSSPFTIRARLLTNYYNIGDGTDETLLQGDEVFLLPGNSINMMDIPECGEIVIVELDKPFHRDAKYTGYWIARANDYVTNEYQRVFNRIEAGQRTSIRYDQQVIHSGETIASNWDYDIKPEPNYEPEPLVRYLPGDVFQRGKSNTHVIHSFNPDSDGDKRGLIWIATELDYIHNSKPLLAFNFNGASKQDIENFQAIQEEHTKYYLDAYRKTNRNRFLNSNGVQVIFATKLNTDRHLIYNKSSKDNTGKYSNIKNGTYFTQFRDEGPGNPNAADASNNIVQIGTEILKQQLTTEVKYNTTNEDVTKVVSNAKDPVVFDASVPTAYLESEEFRFVSRSSNREMNHALLGDRVSTFLQEVFILMEHMMRTQDITREEIKWLKEDYLAHEHGLVPGQTTFPLGGRAKNPFSLNQIYYDTETSGTVGGDSGFDESGNFGPQVDSLIKNRIKEEREKLEDLVKRIPTLLSLTLVHN